MVTPQDVEHAGGAGSREIAVARASPRRTMPTSACLRSSVSISATACETAVNGTAMEISSSGSSPSRQASTSSGGVAGVSARRPNTMPPALAFMTFRTKCAGGT